MRSFLAYMQITVGTVLAALAVNLFLIPFHLPSGGLGGLTLLLHYLWGLPNGWSYLIANIPILFALYRLKGWSGLAKTAWGMTAFSVFLEVLQPLGRYTPTQNVMLASVCGSVMIGLGVGLVVRVGGSTGGTSSLGHIVRHYTGMDIGRFLLVTDMAVLAFAAVALPLESVLYAVIMSFVTNRVVQVVQEGFSTSRCLLIISERPADVSAAILTEMRRGVTRLSGTGEFTGQSRPVLMCVVSDNEMHLLKRLVLATDSGAFVLVMDARNVTGLGFTLDSELRPLSFWATQTGD